MRATFASSASASPPASSRCLSDQNDIPLSLPSFSGEHGSAHPDQYMHFCRHSPGCRGCQRLASVFVGSRDLDRPPVGGLINEEVERPDLVGAGRGDMAGHPPTSPTREL